jgi:hypothetical protein
MLRYPPTRLSLFLLGWTRMAVRPSFDGATIAWLPQGRILVFWRIVIAAGAAAIVAGLVLGEGDWLDRALAVLALAGLGAVLAAELLMPWRGEAVLRGPTLTVTRRDPLGRRAPRPPEALAAFAGLRPWRESWVEVEDRGTDLDGSARDGSPEKRRRTPRVRTWLFLEHATAPGLSLPLLRADGTGQPTPEMEALAARLGAPLLPIRTAELA